MDGDYQEAFADELSPADRLAQAFDHWLSLDHQLETIGPKAVSPEAISEAWRSLLQAHEEWDLSR